MREYRIVATIDTEHGNGRKNHYDEAIPWRDGRLFTHHPYKTKSEALRACRFLRKACKEFDEKTHEEFKNSPCDSIAYTQTNIRVQVREVTKWSNVD